MATSSYRGVDTIFSLLLLLLLLLIFFFNFFLQLKKYTQNLPCFMLEIWLEDLRRTKHV